MQVTEEEMIRCYGKKRIKGGKDQCERRAKGECPWGQFCLSRASEDAENVHYHKANVSVGNIVADFNDLDKHDNDGISTVFEQPNYDNEQVMFDLPDESIDGEEEKDYLELGDGFKISDSARPTVDAVIGRIAELYFNAPASFDCLMKKIFQQKNQSDVARQKNVSRQSVNKRLLYELGIAQKRSDLQARRDRELADAKAKLEEAEAERRKHVQNLPNMTEKEYAVYKICAVDGCLCVSGVARQAKCSRSAVYKIIGQLKRKYGIVIKMANG